MGSSRSTPFPWVAVTLCFSALLGFTISSVVILSLISIYVPNRGVDLVPVRRCRPSFASMTSQATGSGPSVVTLADFNNDRILDLAIANYGESTTSILLGNSNGGFSPQAKLSNGESAGPNGIAAGDLNNDNRIDLAVVNSIASNVGIFLGRGDGTFSGQTTLSTGTNSAPLGLALGNLNNDNVLDLVVSDNATSSLLVFLGNGDGTFTQTTTLPTGVNSQPYSIVIDDFNRDNRRDIVVSNAGTNNIGVFLGNGAGGFAQQVTYATGSSPRTLVAADFNRDGTLDIATANYVGDSTSVLLGNGDGTFAQQRAFSTGSGSSPYAIDSGDFNRDNIPDLIVANSGTNNIGILLGNGGGNFLNLMTYSTGANSYPDDVAVGDFNRDNRLDFISANYNDNTVGIFLNACP